MPFAPRPIGRFQVRAAAAEDAGAIAMLLSAAFPEADDPPEARAATTESVRLLLQTGSDILVALDGDALCGAVRRRDGDGIAWFDLLASRCPGAGRALVRAVETSAQDRGLRLIRVECPDAYPLPELFARWGYLPIGRSATAAGMESLTLEKRLPLLTVREQRRADAAAIAAITGDDPWPYEQGHRPGCFVLADGDRVTGVITVRDDRMGTAEVAEPAVLEPYRGRGLELWMIDRATIYAETRGFHTATISATPLTNALRRDLEDRRWFAAEGVPGAPYTRQLEARAEEGLGDPFD
ncbi:MAG: GNAT family N-acetyltransferase [Chloroflexi bacterium]|nr:GNAT family N-acetyltransferase [Chloroflexota bacterium]